MHGYYHLKLLLEPIVLCISIYQNISCNRYNKLKRISSNYHIVYNIQYPSYRIYIFQYSENGTYIIVILLCIPLNILFNVIHFYCFIPKRITNINYYYSTLPPSSLKLECEKLASEKVEIQRHYVMVRTKFKNEKKDF